MGKVRLAREQEHQELVPRGPAGSRWPMAQTWPQSPGTAREERGAPRTKLLWLPAVLG